MGGSVISNFKRGFSKSSEGNDGEWNFPFNLYFFFFFLIDHFVASEMKTKDKKNILITFGYNNNNNNIQYSGYVIKHTH